MKLIIEINPAATLTRIEELSKTLDKDFSDVVKEQYLEA